jgi:lactoylglutathione lyase
MNGHGAAARPTRHRLLAMHGTFVHTCYRVVDPEASIRFYTECLGLEHVRAAPIGDEATNHFFGYPGDPEPWLELTHNHGRTEPYEIGTGYGHIAIRVSDLDGTLAALDEKGVQPERPPYTVSAGGSRICFVRDPDGYRIELIESGPRPA